MRAVVATVLLIVALASAVVLGRSVQGWNGELELSPPPLATMPPRPAPPVTPRLAQRVILVVIDGLRADESHLPYLDELRARGTGVVARVPYPTISRPNYVTILTGVPPIHSGIRTNRVRAPVAIDTLMDRVHAAGLRVTSASDHGKLASLFLRNTRAIRDVDYVETGTHVTLPPPITWPFDEVHRATSLAALEPALARLVADPAGGLVAVLVLDVDRAGHAAGVGDAYRRAATDVDAMLRTALARVDLARDAIVIVADHGHVARGGHGGTEAETSRAPLVLAGAGIAAGSTTDDARLEDVAPTVAALLGIPAPGHALGRPLLELLQGNRPAPPRIELATPSPALSSLRLASTLGALAVTALLARLLHHRRALDIAAPGSAIGLVAFVAILVAMLAITRGQLSPSHVPSLSRVQKLIGIAATVAIATQLVAGTRLARRRPDRLAATSGIAVVGLAAALTTVALVRAWFHAPHVAMPAPHWMVGIPAIELAAATTCVAVALSLGLALARHCRAIPDRAPS